MPYSGPIYFEAIPCSPACYRCPAALASSSRLQTSTREANVSASLADAGDFEWTRAQIDARTARPSLQPSSPSGLNGPLLSGSNSFAFHPAPAPAPAHTRDSDDGMYHVLQCIRPSNRAHPFLPCCSPSKATEMTPACNSSTSRSSNVLQPVTRRIRERSRVRSSKLTSLSATASTCSESGPFSNLTPHKPTGDPGHVAHSSIWSWVSGVDRGQHPLLDHSVPLRSDSLQFPCDVSMERVLYSPRTIASSLDARSSAAAMSTPGSSQSSPLPVQRFSHIDSASRESDRAAEGSLNDWQYMIDEPPSFLASSPCPSSCSSTMGFTSTLPREPSMLDEVEYRSLLDRWPESEEWRTEEGREREGPTSSTNPVYNVDAYPRSATSSPHHSDVDMHPVVLPALLDQQDFSTLMLQSFTLALADASLEENGGFHALRRATVAEREMEEDNMSNISYPAHLQDFDFMDQWSPPALRSSSSASSLDPFQLELFSPMSEQTDPAAIWSARRSPADSSESLEYFSSSPFVGWSSSSDVETKPVLLTLGHLPMPAPFAEVPLYQPQPIRPIPPIDIPVN